MGDVLRGPWVSLGDAARLESPRGQAILAGMGVPYVTDFRTQEERKGKCTCLGKGTCGTCLTPKVEWKKSVRGQWYSPRGVMTDEMMQVALSKVGGNPTEAYTAEIILLPG